jgi:hypothetical protein
VRLAQTQHSAFGAKNEKQNRQNKTKTRQNKTPPKQKMRSNLEEFGDHEAGR